MARISTYVRDQDIHANDIVVGSEFGGYNVNGIPIYKTKNYRMGEIQEFIHGGTFTALVPIEITIGELGDLIWSHSLKTVVDTNTTLDLDFGDSFSAIDEMTFDAWGHVASYNTMTYTFPDEQPQYYFNITGDATNWSNVASVSQRIDITNTVNINGGDNWISTQSLNTDTVKIFHNDVDRIDPNVAVAAAQLEHSGTFNVITSVTSDIKGHVTAVTETQYTLPDIYSFDITADIPGAYNKEIIDGETLSILGGNILTSTVTDDNTITIDHNPVTHTPIDADPVTLSYGDQFIALTARTVSSEGHLINSTKTTYTLPSAYGFTVTGDDDVVQTITDGNTLDIVGVEPISTSSTTTDTVSITHDNVPRSDGTVAGESPAHGGTFTFVNSITSSAEGHITNVDTKTITLPADNNTTYTLATAPSGTAIRLTGSDAATTDVTLTGGTNVTIARISDDELEIVSTDQFVGTVTSVDTADSTFISGSGGAISTTGSLTYSLSATGTKDGTTFLRGNNTWAVPPGTYSLPLATDGTRGGIQIGYTENGKNYPVELSSEKAYVNVPWTDNNTWNANSLNVAGYVAAPGAVADKVWKTDASGNPAWRDDADTVYTHPTSTQASVNNSGRTYIQDITLDTYGHITGIASATETVVNTDTVYIHPTYSGDDIDIDTTPLSGGTVISDLDFNIGTDTLGHVTEANATFSTRVLTLDDLGYVAYTHPAYTARSIDTSGALVLDIFTSDTTGHVTDISTRTLTLADLGYVAPTINNGTLTLNTSGTGISGSATFTANQAGASTFTVQNTLPDQIVALTGAGATTITGTYPNFTISSTDNDTNTTYTAGTGMSLIGTQFNCTVVNTNTDTITKIGTTTGNLAAGNYQFSATSPLTVTKTDNINPFTPSANYSNINFALSSLITPAFIEEQAGDRPTRMFVGGYCFANGDYGTGNRIFFHKVGKVVFVQFYLKVNNSYSNYGVTTNDSNKSISINGPAHPTTFYNGFNYLNWANLSTSNPWAPMQRSEILTTNPVALTPDEHDIAGMGVVTYWTGFSTGIPGHLSCYMNSTDGMIYFTHPSTAGTENKHLSSVTTQSSGNYGFTIIGSISYETNSYV